VIDLCHVACLPDSPMFSYLARFPSLIRLDDTLLSMSIKF
jgi:hypothetical protein